jgi:hypothetical protein
MITDPAPAKGKRREEFLKSDALKTLALPRDEPFPALARIPMRGYWANGRPRREDSAVSS